MNDTDSRIIALAGTAQAAKWVHDLSQRGIYHSERVESAIDAVLYLEPPTVSSVYGGNGGVQEGLKVIRAQLGHELHDMASTELGVITRYMGQILRLAAKMQQNKAMVEELREGLHQMRRARDMDISSDALRARLASLYSATLSTLTPKIMVQGQPANLHNAGFVEAIRLFLLFGVRSGVLWRQNGGRMWRLFLQRRHIYRGAVSLSRPM